MSAPAHIITESNQPELFLDYRDGEFSVYLPSGDVLSDLVAAHDKNPAVAFLGDQAVRLNQEKFSQPGADEGRST